jgi:hypothetical protein
MNKRKMPKLLKLVKSIYIDNFQYQDQFDDTENIIHREQRKNAQITNSIFIRNKGFGFMVFNTTFNNISVISWR